MTRAFLILFSLAACSPGVVHNSSSPERHASTGADSVVDLAIDISRDLGKLPRGLFGINALVAASFLDGGKQDCHATLDASTSSCSLNQQLAVNTDLSERNLLRALRPGFVRFASGLQSNYMQWIADDQNPGDDLVGPKHPTCASNPYYVGTNVVCKMMLSPSLHYVQWNRRTLDATLRYINSLYDPRDRDRATTMLTLNIDPRYTSIEAQQQVVKAAFESRAALGASWGLVFEMGNEPMMFLNKSVGLGLGNPERWTKHVEAYRARMDADPATQSARLAGAAVIKPVGHTLFTDYFQDHGTGPLATYSWHHYAEVEDVGALVGSGSDILSHVQHFEHQLQELDATPFSDKALTEFGPNANGKQAYGSFADALYSAALLAKADEYGVDKVSRWIGNHWGSFALVRRTWNGCKPNDPNCTNPPPEDLRRLTVTAPYYLYFLAAQHLREQRVDLALDPSAPLRLIVTRNHDRNHVTMLVVNPTQRALQIRPKVHNGTAPVCPRFYRRYEVRAANGDLNDKHGTTLNGVSFNTLIDEAMHRKGTVRLDMLRNRYAAPPQPLSCTQDGAAGPIAIAPHSLQVIDLDLRQRSTAPDYPASLADTAPPLPPKEVRASFDSATNRLTFRWMWDRDRAAPGGDTAGYCTADSLLSADPSIPCDRRSHGPFWWQLKDFDHQDGDKSGQKLLYFYSADNTNVLGRYVNGQSQFALSCDGRQGHLVGLWVKARDGRGNINSHDDAVWICARCGADQSNIPAWCGHTP